jgi:aspartyl-tRNA(Asn)/glutamyl-tRNA(Gln) amidotransferase subunit B
MITSDVRRAEPHQRIQGQTGEWEMVIGTEVHAQVIADSKLFSRAPASFGDDPNTCVSFVDMAMPGMLPVVNPTCVMQAARTGLGLHGQVQEQSIFERKSYFYPDLPQGYQISQFQHPIVQGGHVTIETQESGPQIIHLERLHLEQDAGKLLHDQHPTLTFVDLNRAGVALMEIVSKPDMRSAEEAKAFITKLRMILRYLGTCDGDMEKGHMRVDVNISVRRPGEPFGTRCEIKNVNSIRFIGQAIDYEARRQIDLLERGDVVHQETRLFDANRGETRSMRSKEEAHDYRYFPDPDLPPLILQSETLDQLRSGLPELPDEKRLRLISTYGLTPYDANVLVSERPRADFFERVMECPSASAAPRDGKLSANWVINELLGRLNKDGQDIYDSPVSAEHLACLIDLITSGTISGKIAKEVFDQMWQGGGHPQHIVETQGLQQVTDISAIEAHVDRIIHENPDKVEMVKTKPALLGWFVGQVLKASQGKANPQTVNDLLKQKLGL